jgi:DNA-binding IclR family transcriptional regulator
MKHANNYKEKIEKILLDHPEGLSILEIADHVGVHRHTVTKYIHELIGAGIIHQRDLGTVKLHYLAFSFGKSLPRKIVLEKLKRQIR